MAVVLQQDPRGAARERDLGIRKIGRVTWRAGLAGAACSAVMALAFSHQAAEATSSPSSGTSGSSSSTSSGGGSTSGGGSASTSPATNNQGGGNIVIPSQPPQSASGPSHATSGGTSIP